VRRRRAGEGGLVADAFGGVAGGHQELAGQLDSDAEERNQLGAPRE
jgi:hypothetical protein